MFDKIKVSRMGYGEDSAESSISPWRKKATDVYSLFMAVATLPVMLAVLFLKVVSYGQALMLTIAWLSTLSAAALRRVNVRYRILLMVAAGWIYAAITLTRSGIFLNFRLPLINLAMMALILGGVRFGLVIGGMNIIIMLAAVWGTQSGLLQQMAPQWNDKEALAQCLMVFMNFVPQFLLLAWFSHYLTTSVWGERKTAIRLQEEAALRRRLEGDVVKAGEKVSRHIGSELHDGVCQDLTGLMLSSKRAQKKLEAEHRPEAEVLSRLVNGLGEAIGEIHGLSKRLSPGALTGRDLAGAIEDLVRRFAEASDADIEFNTEGNGPVLDSVATLHLYRIVQEAIANAIRHSGADRIKVLLNHDLNEILVRVDDDGKWLDFDEATQEGLGLHTIQWRASIIGANLSVGPLPEGGTRVQCRVLVKNLTVELNDEL